MQKGTSQLSAFADAGLHLVTKMRTTGSQSVVLRAAAAASPGPLLEIKLSCSTTDLLNQRLWGSGPGSCVFTSLQLILLQLKIGRHRDKPWSGLSRPNHTLLCCHPEGRIKDTWMQGQWSLGPDSVGDLGKKLSTGAGF